MARRQQLSGAIDAMFDASARWQPPAVASVHPRAQLFPLTGGRRSLPSATAHAARASARGEEVEMHAQLAPLGSLFSRGANLGVAHLAPHRP